MQLYGLVHPVILCNIVYHIYSLRRRTDVYGVITEQKKQDWRDALSVTDDSWSQHRGAHTWTGVRDVTTKATLRGFGWKKDGWLRASGEDGVAAVYEIGVGSTLPPEDKFERYNAFVEPPSSTEVIRYEAFENWIEPMLMTYTGDDDLADDHPMKGFEPFLEESLIAHTDPPKDVLMKEYKIAIDRLAGRSEQVKDARAILNKLWTQDQLRPFRQTEKDIQDLLGALLIFSECRAHAKYYIMVLTKNAVQFLKQNGKLPETIESLSQGADVKLNALKKSTEDIGEFNKNMMKWARRKFRMYGDTDTSWCGHGPVLLAPPPSRLGTDQSTDAQRIAEMMAIEMVENAHRDLTVGMSCLDVRSLKAVDCETLLCLMSMERIMEEAAFISNQLQDGTPISCALAPAPGCYLGNEWREHIKRHCGDKIATTPSHYREIGRHHASLLKLISSGSFVSYHFEDDVKGKYIKVANRVTKWNRQREDILDLAFPRDLMILKFVDTKYKQEETTAYVEKPCCGPSRAEVAYIDLAYILTKYRTDTDYGNDKRMTIYCECYLEGFDEFLKEKLVEYDLDLKTFTEKLDIGFSRMNLSAEYAKEVHMIIAQECTMDSDLDKMMNGAMIESFWRGELMYNVWVYARIFVEFWKVNIQGKRGSKVSIADLAGFADKALGMWEEYRCQADSFNEELATFPTDSMSQPAIERYTELLPKASSTLRVKDDDVSKIAETLTFKTVGHTNPPALSHCALEAGLAHSVGTKLQRTLIMDLSKALEEVAFSNQASGLWNDHTLMGCMMTDAGKSVYEPHYRQTSSTEHAPTDDVDLLPELNSCPTSEPLWKQQIADSYIAAKEAIAANPVQVEAAKEHIKRIRSLATK
eukprot:GHVQ01012228.1.p1 GENE.GHVQ01012228.1~~GHVQ01012228.1.p1  ORF type:complete len:868 (+),score=66.24 GHVQ01012228.1:123-2726(+)